MRGNKIPINGIPGLDELANLLMHLIVTLSRHKTDVLEDGLALYTFLYVKSTITKVVYNRRNIVND